MARDLVLGIDTSTAWGGLALIDSRGLVSSTILRVSEGHAKGLSQRVETLLAESGALSQDLSAIGIVNGPGSFTALRVGVATAQGLGMALGIPVVPVGTLEAVAMGLPPQSGEVMVLVPARKGEVFVQTFCQKPGIGWFASDVVDCLKLENLRIQRPETRLLAGPALEIYPEEMRAVFGDTVEWAPLAGRYARGETVAEIAWCRIAEGGVYPAEKVEIRYLQSHGALTIVERSK
jgi:tRNA threonylcarbamoyladenosine biosynthesis protein TsaB